MSSYKEIRTLTAYNLRELCIRQNWYTCGDNAEYEHLLYDLAGGKPHLTTEDIIEIAEDIAAHSAPSDFRECFDIGGIAWEVNRACNVSFMEL
jgi:hypothetical protein